MHFIIYFFFLLLHSIIFHCSFLENLGNDDLCQKTLLIAQNPDIRQNLESDQDTLKRLSCGYFFGNFRNDINTFTQTTNQSLIKSDIFSQDTQQETIDNIIKNVYQKQWMENEDTAAISEIIGGIRFIIDEEGDSSLYESQDLSAFGKNYVCWYKNFLRFETHEATEKLLAYQDNSGNIYIDIPKDYKVQSNSFLKKLKDQRGKIILFADTLGALTDFLGIKSSVAEKIEYIFLRSNKTWYPANSPVYRMFDVFKNALFIANDDIKSNVLINNSTRLFFIVKNKRLVSGLRNCLHSFHPTKESKGFSFEQRFSTYYLSEIKIAINKAIDNKDWDHDRKKNRFYDPNYVVRCFMFFVNAVRKRALSADQEKEFIQIIKDNREIIIKSWDSDGFQTSSLGNLCRHVIFGEFLSYFFRKYDDIANGETYLDTLVDLLCICSIPATKEEQQIFIINVWYLMQCYYGPDNISCDTRQLTQEEKIERTNQFLLCVNKHPEIQDFIDTVVNKYDYSDGPFIYSHNDDLTRHFPEIFQEGLQCVCQQISQKVYRKISVLPISNYYKIMIKLLILLAPLYYYRKQCLQVIKYMIQKYHESKQ